jgi:hypothetical protein
MTVRGNLTQTSNQVCIKMQTCFVKKKFCFVFQIIIISVGFDGSTRRIVSACTTNGFLAVLVCVNLCYVVVQPC